MGTIMELIEAEIKNGESRDSLIDRLIAGGVPIKTACLLVDAFISA
jgi:hypothetical protein